MPIDIQNKVATMIVAREPIVRSHARILVLDERGEPDRHRRRHFPTAKRLHPHLCRRYYRPFLREHGPLPVELDAGLRGGLPSADRYVRGPDESRTDGAPSCILMALAGNEARSAKTVMIVTFGETGVFNHHVPPLSVRTDPPAGATYRAFLTTGVREPPD
jgi:hypothetical protein